MDIDALKEKLGDETFAKLTAHITGYESQIADLSGRLKTVRAKADAETKRAATYGDRLKALEEHFGIEEDAEISSLPSAKGQIEASKQYEAKLKRLEREKAEATERATAAETKFRDSLKRAAVSEALGGHEFVDREVVESFVSQRLQWEGDDLFFKDEGGKLLPVKDGVAGIAKTRPGLLKPTGAGGAGVRQSNAGGGGSGKTMTRSEFDKADHVQRAEFAKAGGKVVSD